MSDSGNESATSRCQNCGEPQSSAQCEECGGRVREYLPMKSPVYEVDVGGMGPIWFAADEYDGAYQHATGVRIDEDGGEPEGESEIVLVDFDGPVEVPVADV